MIRTANMKDMSKTNRWAQEGALTGRGGRWQRREGRGRVDRTGWKGGWAWGELLQEKLGLSTTARTLNFAVSKSKCLTGLKSEVTSIMFLNRADFNSIETLMSPY